MASPRLRPPRVLNDGTKVYDAVLVYAGRKLTYPWGDEIPTAKTLSDPRYLNSLPGSSVIVHHVPGTEHLVGGRAPKSGRGRRVGTVVGARFDAAEGEQGAVIGELAVHEVDDQRVVEALGSVSEAYHADTAPIDQRTSVQTSRLSNSVAITDTPRAPGAHIRTDEEAAMPEATFDAVKALAMISDRDATIAAEKRRADEAEARLVKLEAEAKTRADESAAAANKAKTDRDAEIDRLANERAVALVKLQGRADSLGVKIPDTAVTLTDRTAAVAKALGCPDGTDAAAYIAGVEKTRADSKSRTSHEAFVESSFASGVGGTPRADESTDWPC